MGKGLLIQTAEIVDNNSLLTSDQMIIHCAYADYMADTHRMMIGSTVKQRIAVRTGSVTRYEVIPAGENVYIYFDGETEIIPDDKYSIFWLSGNIYFNVDDLKYNDSIVYISTYHKRMTGDISAFEGKSTITRLNLAGVSDMTGNISVINSIPNLKYLSLGGTGIKGNLSELDTKNILSQFRLFSTKVVGNISAIPTKFPNLTELQITNDKMITGDINSVSKSNLATLTGSIQLQSNSLSGTINTLLLNTTVTEINAAYNSGVEGSKATFKSLNSGNSRIQSNHFDFKGTQVTD